MENNEWKMTLPSWDGKFHSSYFFLHYLMFFVWIKYIPSVSSICMPQVFCEDKMTIQKNSFLFPQHGVGL